MKTPKEQAEELVEKYLKLNIPHYKEKHYIEVAIFSVEHTIEVLEKMKVDYIKRNYISPELIIYLDQQTEILTELKSKL